MKTIGINVCLETEDHSVWSNGALQNVFFFADALMRTGRFRVFIVNINMNVRITPALGWDIKKFPTVNYQDIKDELDVYFTMGAEIPSAHGHYLKARGCRVVHYLCGNRYILDMEQILFREGKGRRQEESYLDEIWMVPQLAKTCVPYMSTTYRIPCHAVPFVWSPEFIEMDAQHLPRRAVYEAKPGPKRVACFEPNMNVVKFCMYDLMIGELAYRRRPELFKAMYVTNAKTLKTNERFVSIASKLDIVRDKVATFETRFRMPFFLATYTDIVVAHQWENALNYAYLDALYLKYPIVHNAHFIKDAGYYYEEFDAERGADQLIHAALHHDEQVEEYERRSAAVLARYRPDNPETLRTYEGMLMRLIETGRSH